MDPYDGLWCLFAGGSQGGVRYDKENPSLTIKVTWCRCIIYSAVKKNEVMVLARKWTAYVHMCMQMHMGVFQCVFL